MARSPRSTKLETRTARSKLKAEHEPFWVNIGRGLHLGYRKGSSGGTWIARFYVDGKYKKQKIAKADDYQDENGIDVLDYFHAQDKAREFANNQSRLAAGVSSKQLTVADAINNYLAWFKTHRKSHARTEHVAKTHILPTLSDHLVSKLTPVIIRNWHEALVAQLPRLRSTSIKQNLLNLMIHLKLCACAKPLLTVF